LEVSPQVGTWSVTTPDSCTSFISMAAEDTTTCPLPWSLFWAQRNMAFLCFFCS
jgi:hypothetical protein